MKHTAMNISGRRHGWVHRGASTFIAATVSMILLVGCGQTYIDSTVTTPPTGSVPGPDSTVPTVTYNTDAPLPQLMDQIEVLLSDLDEQILDEDEPAAVLAAIDNLWATARPQIEAVDPTEANDFNEAILLAHSGVERRRPADASKGYKLYLSLLDHYQIS